MKIVFTEAAKLEIESAIVWYEQQHEGLGIRFAKCFHNTAKRISAYPEFSPILVERIRCALIKEFPYGIIYSISDERIEILAVAHLHRKPLYWR